MKKLIFVFIFFSVFTFAYAGNVDTFGIGSKATALGGAYAAYADDVYATHYNPAGLSQIKSFTISVGAEYLDPNLKIKDYSATDYNGGTVSSNKDFSDTSDSLIVPHFGVAMPVGNFVFGVTAYVPYGLHIKWDDDPAKNPAAYVATESYYIREVVAPTIAYKLNDKWSFGMAVLLGKTYAAEQRRIYAPGLPNHNKLLTVEMEDEFNWSVNLGVMYKPIEELTIGFAYRSKSDVELSGDAKVKGWSGTGGDVDVDNVKIDHPDQYQLGVRYVPIKPLSLEVDVVYTTWSQIDSYTAEFDPALMGSVEESHFNRDWEDTTQVRVGVEWMINDMFSLRGGYIYDPSPIPDDTFDTKWPDGDKNTFSLGGGINFTEHLTLDIVVQYSVSSQKRTVNGESENLNDAYGNPVTGEAEDASVDLEAEGELWGYGATLTYRF